MDIDHYYLYQYENPLQIPAGDQNSHFYQYQTYGSQTGPWTLTPATTNLTIGTKPETKQVTGYFASQLLPAPSGSNDQDTGSGSANQVPIFDWPAIVLMASDSSSDPTDAPAGSINMIAALCCNVVDDTKWIMISLAESSDSIATFNPAGGQPILWGNKGAGSNYCSHPADDKHGYYTQQVIVEISPDNYLKSVSSLTSSGTTATATVANHGWKSGVTVTIAGATPGAYNGAYKEITVVDANTFSYTFKGGTSPATGTITATTSPLTLAGWSPNTTVGSVTDSTSESVSIQLLGKSLGGSASAQSGQSVSLPDFTCGDQSDAPALLVKTTYSIEEYPTPYSLVSKIPPYDLADLPTSAMSNLQLPTQGQWTTPVSSTGIVNFTISITATVAYIEKQFDLTEAITNTQLVTAQRQFIVPVNFAHVFPAPS